MASENDTILTLKQLAPVRILKNPFYTKIFDAYNNGASTQELKTLLGKGRAKKGMFEGDLIEGELEIGQVSAQIEQVIPAKSIIKEFIETYNRTLKNLSEIN